MKRSRHIVSEINITPFVDVMLVLLIIFMVTAPMMTQGLDVDLPTTTHVENLPTESSNMVMTITRDGGIYLDTYSVALNDLEQKLVLLVKKQNKQLFLQADKDVAYGIVVDVMGRIRKAGIEKIGVVAHKLASSAPKKEAPKKAAKK